MVGFLLAGCATNPVSESQFQAGDFIENPGTGGQLVSIDSDNVRAAGYDASLRTMTVQFNNGYTYEYYGVSLELWNSFISSQPDPWSLVGYPQLVQGGFPYKRIK